MLKNESSISPYRTAWRAHGGWIAAASIAVVMYLLTMSRTVHVGDCGEFALVFKILGIAHPPGYPLFTLIGSVFASLFGFLKPALSANLLTAVLAVCAIPALFYLTGGPKNPLLGCLLCLIWALSPIFWSEATAVEVYALNLTLIAALSALVFSGFDKKWYLIAYLLGLSLAHHLSSLALLPGLILVFLVDAPSRRTVSLPILFALLVLGLSVYLYLPVRSLLSPIADWGHPATLAALFHHVTGAQYHYAVSLEGGNILESLGLLSSIILKNWSIVGLLLVILGAAVGIIRQRWKTIFALLLLAANVLMASLYRIPDIESYLLPALLACWLLAAEGIFWLWARVANPSFKYAFPALLGIAALIQLITNYRPMDRSRDRLAENYGKLILDTAEEGLLFTQDDNSSFTTMYLRYAENYRPDVEIFDQSSRLYALCVRASELSGRPVQDYKTARDILLEKSPGPKYLAKSHFPYSEEWYSVKSRLYSQGILYSLNPPTRPASFFPLPEILAASDFKIRQIAINLALCRAETFLTQSRPDSAAAGADFRRAFDLFGDEPRGALWNQLGISYRHFGQEDLALKSYDRALKAPRLNEKERGEIIFNISNIYKDRGNRLTAAGDFAGAVNAFEAALKCDPANPKLLYNVGILYLQYLQQPQKGLPYLQQYLAANPGDEQVRQIIAGYDH
ncbi:MAG TPA: DUF2723 domain-containing protein [bacterium]|jgi:tetratricopeptide (TPR) repeat protein